MFLDRFIMQRQQTSVSVEANTGTHIVTDSGILKENSISIMNENLNLTSNMNGENPEATGNLTLGKYFQSVSRKTIR